MAAPTTVILMPHASSWLNGRRLAASPAGIPAMHSAPIVDSGDTSTRCPAMFIVDAMPSALPPPSFSISPRPRRQERRQHDPDVLEYADTTPMITASGIPVA